MSGGFAADVRPGTEHRTTERHMSALTGLLYGALAVYLGGWYLGQWSGNFSLLLFVLTLVTFGYWLAEPFWGRGIATEALVAVTRYAIETHGLTRVYALPFASNTASCRVLEKAGYVLEARLRRGAIKDGVITDQLQYAFIC